MIIFNLRVNFKNDQIRSGLLVKELTLSREVIISFQRVNFKEDQIMFGLLEKELIL